VARLPSGDSANGQPEVRGKQGKRAPITANFGHERHLMKWPSPDSNRTGRGPLRAVQRRLRRVPSRFQVVVRREPMAPWQLMAVCGPVRVAM
jgi:hypothetical protein